MRLKHEPGRSMTNLTVKRPASDGQTVSLSTAAKIRTVVVTPATVSINGTPDSNLAVISGMAGSNERIECQPLPARLDKSLKAMPLRVRLG